MFSIPRALSVERADGLGARVLLVRVLTAVEAVAVAGCGGKVTMDPEPPGPVHAGRGEYALYIETVGDDCDIVLVSGELGPVSVAVVVKSNAWGTERSANIPVYDPSLSELVPDLATLSADVSRAFVSLDEPVEYAHSPWSRCPTATLQVRIKPLVANSRVIDFERTLSWADLESCPQTTMRDCTARQIYHFTWLRACESESDPDCR